MSKETHHTPPKPAQLSAHINPRRVATLLLEHLEVDETGWVLDKPQTIHLKGYPPFEFEEGYYGDSINEIVDVIYEEIHLQCLESPEPVIIQFGKSGYKDLHAVYFTYISASGRRLTVWLCHVRLDAVLQHWVTDAETILYVEPPRGSSGEPKSLTIPRRMWGRDKLHAAEKVRAYASGILDEQCRIQQDPPSNVCAPSSPTMSARGGSRPGRP